jgi:hypothetical protein
MPRTLQTFVGEKRFTPVLCNLIDIVIVYLSEIKIVKRFNK